MADVIAQVASLPISEITISLIQQKLAVFFQEMFETFTEGRVVEWTKKVRRTGTLGARRGRLLGAGSLVNRTRARGTQEQRTQGPGVGTGPICRGWRLGAGQAEGPGWAGDLAVLPREGVNLSPKELRACAGTLQVRELFREEELLDRWPGGWCHGREGQGCCLVTAAGGRVRFSSRSPRRG